MGLRRLRSNLPQVPELLTSQWPYLKTFRNADKQFKHKQKEHFAIDKRHRAKDLPELPTYTEVWVTSEGKEKTGKIVSKSSTLPSYNVETSTGTVRRNRCHIMPTGSEAGTQSGGALLQSEVHSSSTSSRPTTGLQTGITIRPPERLDL